MARIFDAVSGEICRKDVWKKIRNRLLRECDDKKRTVLRTVRF